MSNPHPRPQRFRSRGVLGGVALGFGPSPGDRAFSQTPFWPFGLRLQGLRDEELVRLAVFAGHHVESRVLLAAGTPAGGLAADLLARIEGRPQQAYAAEDLDELRAQVPLLRAHPCARDAGRSLWHTTNVLELGASSTRSADTNLLPRPLRREKCRMRGL